MKFPTIEPLEARIAPAVISLSAPTDSPKNEGSAINGTSSNISNAVNLLNMTVSDPPTQGEMQAIATKLDELINALRR